MGRGVGRVISGGLAGWTRLRLVATLFLVSAGVTALVAAQLPVLPSTAGADAPPTQPGSAFATAVVLAVNPQYGGLSLVVRGSQSTASYTGSQAVANSQALNLGYIGGLFSAPNSCFSSTGPSATAAVNALVATSGAGASSTSADEGVEAVTVNPTPESASATTSLSPLAVPGLLTITAHSASHVAYASEQDQEADASTVMTVSLLNGLVTLNGLTWSANQEMGSSTTATASFSMASITVAGKTTSLTTPAQLAPAIALANKLLTTLGLTITQPVMSTDAVTGTVTMSPLQLEIVGTAVTNKVLGALNGTETTVEQDIGKVLAEGNGACLKFFESSVGDGELIAGIVEGILAGGGVVDLNLGGASADTQVAPNFVDPLGSATDSNGGAAQLPASPGTTPGGVGGSFDTGSSSSLTSPTSGGGAAPAAAPAQTSTPVAQAAVSVRCVTSSPSGHPGCWPGAATVGAAVLLAVGGALFVADIVRSRRRLVRPKETL
jgi:hypothetical protein